jgi:hypothetical protein
LLRLGLAAGKDAKAVSSPRSSRRHTRASTLAWRSGRFSGRIPARIQAIKGPRGNRITHRISIESIDQVDGFVEKWLTTAYEADE